MKKRFMIVAAAILLAPGFGAGLANAAPAAPQQEDEHSRFSEEDRAAFTDAKIAGLKAGLKLTPAQEKNWPAVEAAIRDNAKARAARWAEWRENAKEPEGQRNVIEMLQRHAKMLETCAGELSKLSNAAKPLYDSLDDSQKRRFGMLLHAIGKHHGDHWGHHWKSEADAGE